MKPLGGLEIGTSHLSAEMQVLHILHNLQVVVNSMRTCIGANLLSLYMLNHTSYIFFKHN